MGYIPCLWQRSSPFPSNWPAPVSPCREDNWTCNSDPGIPIRVSLHPLCIECSSYLSVISLWTSLWPLDQREYTILPVQMHLELKFFFYKLATPDIIARWLCPVYSFKHLLPPERPEIQRATSPSTVCWGRYNSSWGNPTGIIHEGFHIKIFCRAPELNNSCLVSIFIGGGSAGVIRHGRSLGITSTQCGCWLSRFTEVGQEGGNKRKRRVALSHWRLGPPISGKEPAWRRDRVELLTFGEGPLGLDWVMVSAASVKHLY